MSEHGTITNSGRYPPLTFLVTDRKLSCDVTDLINDGAKFTVVIDRVRKKWNVRVPRGKKNDWVYYAVYHSVDRWVKAGIAVKLSKYFDTSYPDLTQKRGIFVRAKATTTPKTPRLINGLQNSKCFAEPQKRLRLENEGEQEHPLDRYNSIPGNCGFWRQQAIRVAKTANRYEFYLRDKNGNLPAQLQQLIRRQQLMFEEWKRETENKSIILRKLTSDKDYSIIPCSTRFTDDKRKKPLILAYNTGVENSLIKHKSAIFVTFTTDPLIWMSQEAAEFTRKIPDPHIDKVHRFTATGRGGNSYAANRHESYAFRKWYETECHRAGYRIPYIRCVEFQENGLIHDHIMLFDYSWDYSFPEFARQWGTKYGQGFMHDVYHVVNDGEKWTWQTDKPADTEGRNPTDYLKKYLIKALYDESGHYAYWVTNKRFFTMSKSLRYLTIQDEIKHKAFLRAHKAIDQYEFVGTSPIGHEFARIAEDIREREGLKPEPRVQCDNRNISEDDPRTNSCVKPALQMWYVPPPPDDSENPDQGAEITAVIPAEPDRSAYDRMLEEESRLMEERRSRLKKRSG